MQDPAATVAAPTAIPGVERKRIIVRPGELAKLSPSASSAVLTEAARQVQSFVVEGARERDVVLWGHRLQQDYSGFVSRTLNLGQAAVLVKAKDYLRRMTDILEAIDLEALGSGAHASGLLGRYRRRSNDRIDTADELNTARRELDQLVELTGGALEELLALKGTLEQHSRRIDELGEAVEAAALAALFLATHLSSRVPALSERFTERSMSLTQTLAQLRESKSIREVYVEQPLNLISAIQNVALLALPGLLGSMAAMTAPARRADAPTPTEIGELRYRLRAILQQLKT